MLFRPTTMIKFHAPSPTSSSPFAAAACSAFSLAASCHAGIPGRLGRMAETPLFVVDTGGVSVPGKLTALEASPLVLPELANVVFNVGVDVEDNNPDTGVKVR